jgi:hypothetical protein
MSFLKFRLGRLFLFVLAFAGAPELTDTFTQRTAYLWQLARAEDYKHNNQYQANL